MCEAYRVTAVVLKVQLGSLGHQQIDHLRVTVPGGQHEARHATPGQKGKKRSCVYYSAVLPGRKSVHGLSPSPFR